MNNPVYVKFESGMEDRWSEEFGPYEFVQLTYTDLRVGPNGDTLAFFGDGQWRICGKEEGWTDVVIFNK